MENLQKTEPRGNPFQNALSKEYLAFAESQQQRHDVVDTQYFAEKGLKAAKGQTVLPDKVENWSITGDIKSTMKQARVYLVDVLIPEVTTRVPNEAARGQLLFDCWLEQQERTADDEQIPPCREEFYEVLDSLYSHKLRIERGERVVDSGNSIYGNTNNGVSTTNNGIGGGYGSMNNGNITGSHRGEEYVATGTSSATVQPNVLENPKLTFTVYFDFNSSALRKATEAKLGDIAQQLRKQNYGEIVVSGHTDRSGPTKYNNKLSQRRAENVKNKLISLGVDKKRISVFGYGELYPQVQTADGVKNRANRRVRIVIRNKAD